MLFFDSVRCFVIRDLTGGKRSANFKTSFLTFLATASSFVNKDTTPLVPKYINLDKCICLFSNSLKTASEPISLPFSEALMEVLGK